MVVFDWAIEAGPFGKQTAFAIDAIPAFWIKRTGDWNDSKLDTKASVKVVKKLR
jgi:hypothetical protein